MEKIKFDNIEYKWLYITLMVISLFFILIGGFQIIYFENPKVYSFLSVIGFLIQTILNSRMFWFKNYVFWNNKGIVIRIKSFLGVSISFEDISNVMLENKMLKIIMKNNKIDEIYLNNIYENDIEKLMNIFNNNSKII